ncbi:hypothetical protein BC351_18675 [Paenibacillus ferrarius]|uniref:Ricin B lectin domain-containing protein n=1 Tax=Paenibacillus ferrarius TaxID=1469647 RepID=A0A1V4HPF7_9BACL|nr:RICIN domain-containing protein [Paenibacillus ferrarius]OPH59949.1 hypothetical protein BC351_18675 [Paenibacillus ferrarius]
MEVGSSTSDIPAPTGIDTFDSNAVYRIVNKGSGKALGVGNSLNEGAAVAQRTSLDEADQQWIIDDLGLGNFKIVNKLSGKTMNVSGNTVIQSTDSETSASPPSKTQQWTISNVGNGYFKIINAHRGKDLENRNSSASDGNPTSSRDYYGGDHQLWQVQKIADNYVPASYYKIVNLKSNKVLDISGGSLAAGADNIQAPYTGSDNQLWKIESVGNGNYKITSKNTTGYAPSVNGVSNADGAKIVQLPYSGATSQQWKLQFIGKGLYQISSVSSGKALEVKDGSILDNGTLVQNPFTNSSDEKWAIVKVQ